MKLSQLAKTAVMKNSQFFFFPASLGFVPWILNVSLFIPFYSYSFFLNTFFSMSTLVDNSKRHFHFDIKYSGTQIYVYQKQSPMWNLSYYSISSHVLD